MAEQNKRLIDAKKKELKHMSNNEVKKIELEEGEIMRLSVRMVNSEKGEYRTSFASNGPAEPMVHALMDACENFDMVCLPAVVLEGIPAIAAAICCFGGPNPFNESEEGEEAEKGKGNIEQ